MSKIHEETNNSPPQPLIKRVNINDYFPQTPAALYKPLFSSDGFFCIKYILEHTLKPCWFFVQTNYDETHELNIEPQTT